MKHFSFASAVLSLGSVAYALAAAASPFESRCDDFADQVSLPNTTIWFTETVAAGTNLTFPESHSTCNRPFQVVNETICRVVFLVDTFTPDSPASNISMEAWLPSDWSGRFLAIGNGGLNGCIQYEDLAYTSAQGFAALGGNNGHNGTSGAPFYKNAGAVEDFVYRSVHLYSVIGKQITEAFYEKEHSKAYYLGCSTGGRQGFKAAQDFPGDFDGIVAGAPALRHGDRFSHTASIYQNVGEPGSPTFLTKEEWEVVEEDMLRQCDHLDGAGDGIIEDPNLCRYRPEALLCGSESSAPEGCLTPPQVESVRGVYSDTYGNNGTLLWPRLQPGVMPRYNSRGTEPANLGHTRDWFRYVVFEDPDWDPKDLTMEGWALSTEMNPYNFLTWEGDLSSARGNGTKILHYHGLEDDLLTSDQSDRYYEHVSRTMNLRPEELDEFYRYFRISGLAHCTGGNGAWKIGNKEQGFATDDPDGNVLWSIVRWVEDGIGPDFVRGTGGNGNGTMTRNHCKYPSRTTYKGSGDASLADSWTCS